jgi:hypothetical protein
MSALAEFVQNFFTEGQALFHAPPSPITGKCRETLAVLSPAYADLVLEVAGPAIPFDGSTAQAAADVLRHACWFLVSRGEPVEVLGQRLQLPGPPVSPAQHLSADLMLRYLPQIHRRARALGPQDPLAGLLAELLRYWPLSGVLAEIAEEPLTELTFGDHDGLLQLYAERLAAHQKPAWMPPPGRGREFVELVFMEREKRP